MFIQQLYTNCLSEAAYYIESNKEALVIDPLRDVEMYIHLAEERGATIKYILETHFHADFVSGHLDLSRKTGAPIVYGPGTETAFPIYKAADGETFRIGDVSLEVLHTPGHTIESTCYLLKDEQGAPHALFTGDTLFVGDVGRPDLSSGSLSKEELAGMLYDSLAEKVLPLPDSVIIYPAHGPGSSCGKNLGPHTHSTLGEEKATNYALQPQDKETFIKAVTEGLSAPPQYFPVNARINKEGYESLEKVMHESLQPLSIAEFKKESTRPGAVILDTRKAPVFTDGFVPGSINIGLEGRFAEWAGNLLGFTDPIVLVTDEGMEEESILRLARVGFENVSGYLQGGFDAWKAAGQPIDMIINVTPYELALDIPFDENLVVVDVRKEIEFGGGHVKGAENIPLETLSDPGSMAYLEENQNIYVHCAGGYRSVIACSLLKRQGLHNLRNVTGGWTAIQAEGSIPVVKESAVLN
ncbi:MBL fold metallo-hydrolase [Dinghuibacter silviterrae]|uniref:Glyoxylase-like metal-dependent hydrolase (Beta-lactamase superfamily II) n=1 Tax=Dinghuibacter silviterrae TaxID=1539049 RepID=A0A4R8DQD8_9BACT|nr:MBL fold metallo-hydrolase [Dinghuibacter silviterrae]TDW99516.1 glyoxylase-like metal-dependent hydrolase (beta-lactamase superfamily II) [Dinghuibacter silviterrae]